MKPASGFMVAAGSQYYLITNLHVLTGKDSSTIKPQEPGLEPHRLKTWLHVHGELGEASILFSLGMRKGITIQLYDDHGVPRWIERRGNQQNEPMIDIVALPIHVSLTLRLFSGSLPGIHVAPSPWARNTDFLAKISAIPLSAIDTDLEYGPPDTVHIIGYPHGWAPEGIDKSSSAFWRTSFIASEMYEAGTIRSNTFYVDPCAPDGMTGSPVVGFKNDRLKLLGVYSDRSTAGFGANTGSVWDARLLKELIGTA